VTTFREAFPIITVDDVDRAIDFYRSTFGFEQTYSFESEGTTAYAFLRLEPLGIGLARRASRDDPDFALWL
jgi:predicted enzyme related to lactoylglutathione lyase